MIKKKFIATIVATSVLALALAPAAIAQNSSAQVYGGQGTEAVAGATGGPEDPGATGTASTNESSLPFTGLDVGLLAGGGLLLLLIGLGMARVIPRHEHSA